MKKRTLSLLLAVACALSLSGCGGAPAPDAQTSAPAGSETPAAVDQTREIVFAASRDQCPGEQDAYYASMSLGVWEPLITKDESGKPAPALATEWEHNEDSTVWTFHLREGVTFSNGTPFNADSVLANFDRMKKGPFESSFYGMNIDTIYPGLVSYEKTDDYTVVLTLSEGQPLLDYTMVNYGSAIFEPSCFAEDGTFAGFPIGTGPYVVTENVLGQYCVIERNDNYWGTPGIAKTFRFKVIPDAETRYPALRAGEVQGLCDLGAISPSQAAEIDGDPAYNVSVGDSGITHFLNVNGGAFPFNDVRMREGLSLLLDRQTIIDSFYNGYGLAAGGFLTYTSAFYREQPVQHDPRWWETRRWSCCSCCPAWTPTAIPTRRRPNTSSPCWRTSRALTSRSASSRWTGAPARRRWRRATTTCASRSRACPPPTPSPCSRALCTPRAAPTSATAWATTMTTWTS